VAPDDADHLGEVDHRATTDGQDDVGVHLGGDRDGQGDVGEGHIRCGVGEHLDELDLFPYGGQDLGHARLP
jgi:hypothetical protein